MNVIDGEVSIRWKQFDLKNTLVAELLFVDFCDDSIHLHIRSSLGCHRIKLSYVMPWRIVSVIYYLRA